MMASKDTRFIMYFFENENKKIGFIISVFTGFLERDDSMDKLFDDSFETFEWTP